MCKTTIYAIAIGCCWVFIVTVLISKRPSEIEVIFDTPDVVYTTPQIEVREMFSDANWPPYTPSYSKDKKQFERDHETLNELVDKLGIDLRLHASVNEENAKTMDEVAMEFEFVEWSTSGGGKIRVPYRKMPSSGKLEEKQDDTKQHDNEMYAMGKVMVARNLAEQAINEAHSVIQQLTFCQSLVDRVSKHHDTVDLVTEQLTTLARQITANDATLQLVEAVDLQQKQINLIEEQIQAVYDELDTAQAIVTENIREDLWTWWDELLDSVSKPKRYMNVEIKEHTSQNQQTEMIVQEANKVVEDAQNFAKAFYADLAYFADQSNQMAQELLSETNIQMNYLTKSSNLNNNAAIKQQQENEHMSQHQQTEKAAQIANKAIEETQKWANDVATLERDVQKIAAEIEQQNTNLEDTSTKKCEKPFETTITYSSLLDERPTQEWINRVLPQDAKNEPICRYLIATMNRLTPSEELWNWTFDAIKDACTEEFATKTRNLRELQLKITGQNTSKYWMIHRDTHILVVWSSWLFLLFFGLYMIFCK